MIDYLPGCKSVGSGPALIFLHGLGGNRHAFDAQVDKLAHRYRCISWDAPGYCGTAALADLSFENLAQSLTNLLTHLAVEPYAVVGHSMGAMVAQTWLRLGGTCQRLVLAQTSARFGKPGSQWNEDFLAARLQPLDDGHTPADFARPLIKSMFHDPSNTLAIDAGIATMSELTPALYRQLINCLVTFDERDNLGSIKVPTLCLAAEYDDTAPPEGLRRLAAALPNATYHCLTDAGHLAYIERPTAFTEAVESFLEA